jgi:hypothetical protein
MYTAFSYRLIRHGTNDFIDGDNDGLPDIPLIYGGINIPINYNLYDSGAYGTKDFLHDGVYDWSNIISLEASYTLQDFPLEVGLEYIFSHTFWVGNGYLSSSELPDPIIQNILSLSFTFFK